MPIRIPVDVVKASMLAFGLVIVACESRSPSSPTPESAGIVKPLPPVITSVTPSAGATTGGTVISIRGSRFQVGTRVTLDGIETAAYPIDASDVIRAPVLPHAAGRVDVVVINPDGQRSTLRGGFSYEELSPSIVGGPAPSIRSVSPDAGITSGDTFVEITGSGFQPGLTVSLGGVRFSPNVFGDTIFVRTLPHAAGLVDVVVTNPDGQNAVRTGGYKFADPESLNFNGRWVGAFGEHWDYALEFTVDSNRLVSVSCRGGPEQFLEEPPSTTSGQFTSAAISGKFFSSSYGLGALNLLPCGGGQWEAWKR